jgi:hypothetical protein
LLDEATASCPVCHPHSEVPEHIKEGWAIAHLSGVILHLGQGDAVVREASLLEEHAFLEDDARPLLLRMEDDGEIERFAGPQPRLGFRADRTGGRSPLRPRIDERDELVLMPRWSASTAMASQ